MIDLHAFHRQYIAGWGDRMTVGVQVRDLTELVNELMELRERHRVHKAALDSALVQRDYWERMARAVSVERDKLALQVQDLLEAKDGVADAD